MIGNDEVSKFYMQGRWFQLPMIFIWMLRGAIYNVQALFTTEVLASFVSTTGLVLMVVSMVRIYGSNKRTQLITSDIFSLTRHPMYHGMFIADAGTFFIADLSQPLFWISWILFTALLFTAGWYQEKETLARWGKEAEVYYSKTPRFIVGWLRKLA